MVLRAIHHRSTMHGARRATMPTNTSTASTINDTLRPTRVLPARPRATAVVLAFLLVVLAALFPVIAADSLNNDGNAILATASPTAIALTSTTTAPGDHSDFNPAGGFRAIASNISSTGMRSLCPADYRARNGYCWLTGSRPYLQIQNKFMNSYAGAGDSRRDGPLKEVDAYSVVLTAWYVFKESGARLANQVEANIPLPNVTIPISHDGTTTQRLLLPDRGIVKLPPGKRLALQTNRMGKVMFGVLLDGHIDKPLFRAYPPFAVHAEDARLFDERVELHSVRRDDDSDDDDEAPVESLVFAVDAHAVHELSQLTGHALRSKHFTNDAAIDDDDNQLDHETADAAAEAVRHLTDAVLHGDVTTSNGNAGRVHKRSLDYQSTLQGSAPFHPQTNMVAARLVTDRRLVKRHLAAGRRRYDDDEDDDDTRPTMQVRHWELDFDHELGHQFVAHTHDSMRLRKRGISPSPLESAPARTSPPGPIHIYRRHSTADSYLGKVKEFGGAVWNLTKSTFYEVPRAIFNVTAMKHGSEVYGAVVGEAMYNVTANSIDTAHDFIETLPNGEQLNQRLGIEDLAQRVADSKRILVTHQSSGGMEVVIVGYNNTVSQAIVTQTQEVFAVVAGIFRKIRIAFDKVIAYIKAVFNWDDVLLNHRILASHLEKMIPFIQAEITNQKGNLSTSLSDTMKILTNYVDEATTMTFNANFTSFGGLFNQANNMTKEFYKNATTFETIDYENQETVPQDLQSTFVADHLASSDTGIAIDIAEDDQNTIAGLAKQAADAAGMIREDSADKIKSELETLQRQVESGKWTLGTFFATITRIIGFGVRFIAEKVIQGFLLVFQALLSVFDKILRMNIKIPFISNFYHTVVTRNQSELSAYGLFSLASVVPMTAAFRLSYPNATGMFTQPEAEILINTQNPEFYVDNLVAYGMMQPDRNATALRNMYRRSVSWILGAGYSLGQLIVALVGPLTTQGAFLYIMRAPFELMAIMCNYPWRWYTNSITPVGLNVRFVSWFFQFLPILMFGAGWAPEVAKMTPKGLPIPRPSMNWFGMVTLLFNIVPNLFMIIRVFLTDMNMLRGSIGKPIDGQNQLDVMLKGIGKSMIYGGRTLLYFTLGMEPISAIMRATILTGAVMQSVRLFIDIPRNVIYSV